MCGRYTLTVSQRPELRDLGLQTADRYNIAPQTSVLVKDEHNQHRLMPWDYSPPWAKTPMHISNARSETLREKPSFRKARRCVFLADGWYEWQRQPGGKIPWFHHLQGELIYFAGIYNNNSGCAIVTRNALDGIAHIHHRQPVLLDPRGVSHWLEGHDLFASAITHDIQCHPVSRRVNRPVNDDEGLTHEVALGELKAGKPDTRGRDGDLFDGEL